jgi:hypothetical protein
MWEEVIIAYITVLFQHLPGGPRKSIRNSDRLDRRVTVLAEIQTRHLEKYMSEALPL